MHRRNLTKQAARLNDSVFYICALAVSLPGYAVLASSENRIARKIIAFFGSSRTESVEAAEPFRAPLANWQL